MTSGASLDRRTTLVLLAGLFLCAVLDETMARFIVDGSFLWLPVVWIVPVVAVLVARWNLVAAVVTAAMLSLTVSALVRESSTGFEFSVTARRLVAEARPPMPSFTELIGMAALLVFAVRLLPVAAAVGAGAATALAFALMPFRWSGRGVDLLFLGFAVGIALSVGAGVALRWNDAEQRAAVHRAGEAERAALARELHDVVAHHVTGMVLQAQAAKLTMANDPDVAARALDEIERAGVDALRSMRSLVSALRTAGDSPLAPSASVADLTALAAGPGEGGPAVTVNVGPGVAAVPPVVLATLHRIAMEAVSNSRRHAVGATHVTVDVTAGAGTATVRAVDDGRTTTANSAGGFGLVGIAERVAAMNGHLRAGPGADGGWELVATVHFAGAA